MRLEITPNLCVVCGAASCEAFTFHGIIQRCVIPVDLADSCKTRWHVPPSLGSCSTSHHFGTRQNTNRTLANLLNKHEIEAPAVPPASQRDGKQAATPRRAPRKLGVLPRLVTVIHLKLLSPRRVVASVQRRSGIRHQTACRSRRQPVCRCQERLSHLILGGALRVFCRLALRLLVLLFRCVVLQHSGATEMWNDKMH